MLPSEGSALTTKFSTCGADGRVLLWDLQKIDVNLADLKLG